MEFNLNDKLVDNELSSSELHRRVIVSLTKTEDYDNICATLAKAFNLSPEEVDFQLTNSNVLIENSVKLIDIETNEIYGLLMFCEYPISHGSPLPHYSPQLSRFLSQYDQVNGHSFVIDKRLRGFGYDKLMLNYNKEFLRNTYDFVWCAVEKTLKSRNYWRKHGFMDFFRIREASFYIMPLKESWLYDIYRYIPTPTKGGCQADEKNYCN